MSTVPGVPAMLMRGGSSKGLYFLADDLPREPEERDDLLIRIMGSPDARQIDGVGGAHPLTSKVAVVSAALAASRERDLSLGFTGIGPHPDEMKVSLDGIDLRKFGSAGQQRAAMIGLKLAKLDLLEEASGEQEVLRDDLKRIKGVGPAIEKTLNEMGIYRYEQIAAMSEYEIDRVAQRLKGFHSRIYREDWMGQARELLERNQSA